MKSLKKFSLARVLFIGVLACLLQSCSTVVTLRQAPSDLVLLSIEPNNNIIVAYEASSKLPNPFVYKNKAGYEFHFALNQSFRNNVDTYIRTKFNNITQLKEDATHTLIVELVSCDVQYELEQSTSEVLAGIADALSDRPSKTRGTAIVDTKMNVCVKIMQGEQVLGEKVIVASVKSKKNIENVKVRDVYANAVDECISKSIIMIDKYLSSLNI